MPPTRRLPSNAARQWLDQLPTAETFDVVALGSYYARREASGEMTSITSSSPMQCLPMYGLLGVSSKTTASSNVCLVRTGLTVRRTGLFGQIIG
jgi:hypothetical protein